MGVDGLTLRAVVAELEERLAGGRVERIWQPDRDEIVLAVYAGGRRLRLLASAHPRFARLHLIWEERANPPVPPPFCMLLRKHLEGARLVSVHQDGLERVVRLSFAALDELGEPVERALVVEMMGRHSNIILVDGRQPAAVLDAVRRVPGDRQRREVLPGRPYLPPPPQDKADPRSLTAEEFIEAMEKAPPGKTASEAVLDLCFGFSPLLAREACVRSAIPPTCPLASLAGGDRQRLWQGLRGLVEAVEQGTFTPTLVLGPGGEAVDFSAFELDQFPPEQGYSQVRDPSPSRIMDRFYAGVAVRGRLEEERRNLERIVAGHIDRVARKGSLQEESLAGAARADEFRIAGELILANLGRIRPGTTAVDLVNYYDPDGNMMRVELDPALGPAENAQAYFRRYARARNTRTAAGEQLSKSRAEREYLDSVLAAIRQAETPADLAEIRRELVEGEYIRERGRRAASTDRSAKQTSADPLRFVSSDGLEILVGKNNRQNEHLTMKLARPDDLWLHVKDLAGSHVLLRLPPGGEAPPRSLEEAAHLAAYYSRGRDSSQVPVDYTRRRHVRRHPSGRPGMVIYDHHQTVYITPDRAAVEALARRG